MQHHEFDALALPAPAARIRSEAGHRDSPCLQADCTTDASTGSVETRDRGCSSSRSAYSAPQRQDARSSDEAGHSSKGPNGHRDYSMQLLEQIDSLHGRCVACHSR
eukprot:3015992-Pleurochrysis_carterae.AAC.2